MVTPSTFKTPVVKPEPSISTPQPEKAPPAGGGLLSVDGEKVSREEQLRKELAELLVTSSAGDTSAVGGPGHTVGHAEGNDTRAAFAKARVAAEQARAQATIDTGKDYFDKSKPEDLGRFETFSDSTLAECAAISNSYITPLFFKMAQNLDLRCVLVPAPWVLGPKHVSNPE